MGLIKMRPVPVFLIWILLLVTQETCGISKVRGADPQKLHLYENKEGFFHCLNSSQKVPYSSLNDDFCDCDDGTDEPGTAACDGSTFYCENIGYVPVNILSSQVNDGICDCCDGSDEWLGYVDCPNRCVQNGKERIEQMLAEVKIIKQGLKKREELKSLSSLRFSELVNKTKLLQVSIHEAEVLERKAKKELHWLEHVLRVIEARDIVANASVGNLSSHSSGDVVTTNEESSNDLGRTHSLQNEDDELNVNSEKTSDEVYKSTMRSDFVLETCQNISKVYTSSHMLLRLQKLFFDFLSKFPVLSNFFKGSQRKIDTEVLKLCISNLKEHLETLRSELEKNRTELERVQQYFSSDYGPENVFLALRDICLEVDSQGYHYKLCLLSHVTQDSINLGKFSQWDSNYTKMIFSDGTPCWNGPARSTVVNLLCGVNETILKVSEPSKCQYHFWMTTCAVCSVHEMKKLRDEANIILSNLNLTKGQKSNMAHKHDEL
ncbi:Glucosidase 2 subunit beta [Galdieria sulphuraria]|uniref:Glucosidase 2 subunit beta n=1 Tax=Galdieria sulphuraria TaxID=130081 RepID=M2Y7I3_GALSU|nr:protein kinase C substrate 8K-H [Galdieria sulphuraria]EME31789.1 protein kinase C substrate 8K-H [Galdieria sulphuraria]GJD10294.1 Glucosidase 2 subunit beta [Galdieria sulphuraria]|eukprot:XP_005708309.1 protein kinase C substrate 8K-H [Galdieria sulphuraria]